jgi:hypothetical protein
LEVDEGATLEILQGEIRKLLKRVLAQLDAVSLSSSEFGGKQEGHFTKKGPQPLEIGRYSVMRGTSGLLHVNKLTY